MCIRDRGVEVIDDDEERGVAGPHRPEDAAGTSRRSTLARRLSRMTARFNEASRPPTHSSGEQEQANRSRVREMFSSVLRCFQRGLQAMRRLLDESDVQRNDT